MNAFNILFTSSSKFRWSFLGLLFICASQTFGQEMDTVAMDTLEKEPPAYYGGIYLKAGASVEPSARVYNAVAFGGVGIQYEKWLLEFTVHEYMGSFQTLVIFPNAFDLSYRYGGVSIGYQLHQTKWITLLANASFFRGDMIWNEVSTGRDFFRDEYNLWKGGVSIEMSRVRYAKLYLQSGYQKIQALDLEAVNSDDFSGIFISAGIRVGYFNQ